MAQIINTNSLANLTQTNLSKSQSALSKSMERLSSGKRINTSADDAAGKAIVTRFNSNIRGFDQAKRNANDGISLAQSAEGSLAEITENLQRIRELAIQSRNDTNSADNKKSINDEIQQRKAQIQTLSEQAEFNGIKYLTKDITINIQTGAKDGEVITMDFKKIDQQTLNVAQFDARNMLSGNVTEIKSTTGGPAVQIDTSAITVNGATAGPVKLLGYGAVDSAGNYSTYVAQDADGKLYQFNGTITAGAATGDLDATGAAGYDTLVSAGTISTTDTLDKALDQISALTSQFGAVSNRLLSVIANLDNGIVNLSDARSRIEDADFAVEAQKMSSQQIIQQAGMQVLARANQLPSSVLSLLQ